MTPLLKALLACPGSSCPVTVEPLTMTLPEPERLVGRAADAAFAAFAPLEVLSMLPPLLLALVLLALVLLEVVILQR